MSEDTKHCQVISATHRIATPLPKLKQNETNTLNIFQSQLFSSSESPANTGQDCSILKWQSILAKWCHAACHVGLCGAASLFLISAAVRSWWGQTAFLSHLKVNRGALAAKQKVHPKLHFAKDAGRSLFLSFLLKPTQKEMCGHAHLLLL